MWNVCMGCEVKAARHAAEHVDLVKHEDLVAIPPSCCSLVCE